MQDYTHPKITTHKNNNTNKNIIEHLQSSIEGALYNNGVPNELN